MIELPHPLKVHQLLVIKDPPNDQEIIIQFEKHILAWESISCVYLKASHLEEQSEKKHLWQCCYYIGLQSIASKVSVIIRILWYMTL